MSHLLPGALQALSDTTIGALTTNEVLQWNGTAWVNTALSSASFTIASAPANGTSTLTAGDTLTFARTAATDTAFTWDTNTADQVGLGWSVAPDTGGTTQQVLVWDDNLDTYSWDSPISIAAGSATMLSFDTATRELSLSNLAITDVTVEGVSTDIATYVGTSPVHEEGDTVILTAATGGAETWIHNGGSAGTAADYTQINDAASLTTLPVKGDTATTQQIINGETLTLDGTNGINTDSEAANTVQFKLGGALTEATSIAGGTFSLDFTTTTGGINLTSTGAAAITLDANTGGVVVGQDTALKFQDTDSSNFTTFSAGAQIVDIDYTLPVAAPTAGQILSSDAAGVLSWTTAAAGTFDITDGTTTSTVTTGTDTIDFNNGFTAVDVATTPRIELGGTIVQDTTFTASTFDMNWNSTTGGFNAVATGSGVHSISSVGGSINFGETTGTINSVTTTGDITASTTTGDFTVSSTGAAAHSIISVGGSVTLLDNTGTVNLTTTSGTINATSTTGPVNVTSTTGDVTVGSSSTGSLIHQGEQVFPIATKTASYTMLESDYTIIADGNSAPVVITLPATPTIGTVVNVKAIDLTNSVSLTTVAAHKIDAAQDTHTFTIAMESVTLVYSAVNQWHIL